MTTDYGLAYLRALREVDPTLITQLAHNGKLEKHLASVRKRAASMHVRLADGWKRQNPFDPKVHQTEQDHDQLANRKAEELVLRDILPLGKED